MIGWFWGESGERRMAKREWPREKAAMRKAPRERVRRSWEGRGRAVSNMEEWEDRGEEEGGGGGGGGGGGVGADRGGGL